MSGKISGKLRWSIALVFATAVCGCGGDESRSVDPPPGICLNMGSASYVGTEDVDVTSGDCSSYSDLEVTLTVVQADGNCEFTLLNSLVPGTTFSGTVSGSDVSWTGSYPLATGTVTIDEVDAELSTDLTTLTGYFTWTYAGSTQCTGTTTFQTVKQ